jgi:hypothetical protein
MGFSTHSKILKTINPITVWMHPAVAVMALYHIFFLEREVCWNFDAVSRRRGFMG